MHHIFNNRECFFLCFLVELWFIRHYIVVLSYPDVIFTIPVDLSLFLVYVLQSTHLSCSYKGIHDLCIPLNPATMKMSAPDKMSIWPTFCPPVVQPLVQYIWDLLPFMCVLQWIEPHIHPTTSLR